MSSGYLRISIIQRQVAVIGRESSNQPIKDIIVMPDRMKESKIVANFIITL